MDMEILFPGGKRVDAVYDGLRIRTDQSGYPGADETAPAPFDLFLASIGTCAGIYVLVFCQKRGIPTEGLKLVQRAERSAQSGMIDKIRIEIQLPHGFPEKYRKAVVRAAELCTVKKHLQDPPGFEIYTSP